MFVSPHAPGDLSVEFPELDEMATQQLLDALKAQSDMMKLQMEAMQKLVTSSTKRVKEVDVYKGDRRDAERFMLECETYQNLKDEEFGSQTEKILHALQRCKAGALDWAVPYLSTYADVARGEVNTDGVAVKAPFSTWKEFKEEFLKSFGSADPAAEARAELQNFEQKGTISEYTSEFMRLGARSGLSDLDLLEKYRRGLKFRVKMALATKEYRTLRELRDEALSLERNWRAMGIGAPARQGANHYTPRGPARDPNAMDVDATKVGGSGGQEGGSRPDTRTCFKCQKTGHVIKWCPENKCHNCDKSWALRPRLPQPEEGTAEAPGHPRHDRGQRG